MLSVFMRVMFEGKEGVVNEWDQEVFKICCGDYFLVRVVYNYIDFKVNNMVSYFLIFFVLEYIVSELLRFI